MSNGTNSDDGYKSYVQRMMDAFSGSASPSSLLGSDHRDDVAPDEKAPGISLHKDFSEQNDDPGLGGHRLKMRHKAADWLLYGVRPGMLGAGYVVLNPQGQKNPQTGERAFTPEQIKRALMQLVLEKGCTKIYCFKGNKSDMALRSQVMGALIDLQNDRRYGHIFNRVGLALPFEHEYKAFKLPWPTGAFRNALTPITQPLSELNFNRKMWLRDTKQAWAGHRYKDLPPPPPQPQ